MQGLWRAVLTSMLHSYRQAGRRESNSSNANQPSNSAHALPWGSLVSTTFILGTLHHMEHAWHAAYECSPPKFRDVCSSMPCMLSPTCMPRLCRWMTRNSGSVYQSMRSWALDPCHICGILCLCQVRCRSKAYTLGKFVLLAGLTYTVRFMSIDCSARRTGAHCWLSYVCLHTFARTSHALPHPCRLCAGW